MSKKTGTQKPVGAARPRGCNSNGWARPPASHHSGTLVGAISLILAASAARAATPAADSNSDVLQEITVTAQRRSQSAQDIPYNISVLSSDQLLDPGLSTASDLAKVVPGLLTVDSGPAARGNNNSFTLRGLRTDNPGSVDIPSQTVSPVSTYMGETPVFVPFVLRDLDRVEILRGPQGTLYGSGAEAGTIRFIPNQPKFGEFSGEVSSSLSKTEYSGSMNNRVDAVLNLPIADQLAARLIAGSEHLAGFINDVGLATREGTGFLSPPVPRVPNDPTSGFVIKGPLHDANTSTDTYERGAVRWDPHEGADILLTYLHQHTQVADGQYGNPNWPGGTQNLASGYTGPVPPFANSSYTVPAGGTYNSTALIQEPYDNTLNLGSLVASVDFGFATFTSATSSYETVTDGTFDNTYQWYIPGGTNFLTYYNNYPRTIAVGQQQVTEKSWVQEMRLVSNGTHTFDYVVGAYYERQTVGNIERQWFPGVQQYYSEIGAVSANPQLGDLTLYTDMNTTFNDRAVFGELTWHITPAWQVTGGTRFFDQSFDVNFTEVLPFCGSTCGNSLGAFSVYNALDDKNHLWKLNSSYDLTDHTKLYATFSEGFRRGGATGLPPEGIYASLPKYFTYQPDFTKNYEIGIKGSALNSKVQYTADIFVINLNDFQFNSFSPSGLPAVYNGSTARSKGAEIEVTAKLTQRITGSLGYSYTDAYVTQATNIYDLPAFGGPGSTPVLAVAIPEGTRLPGVPKNVVTTSVHYRVPLAASGWSTDWHADGVYRTSAPGAIPGVYVTGWTLDTSKVLNAGVTLDNGKQWSFDLFGTNLTSDAGVSGAVGNQGLPLNTLHYVNVSRPRTIGLSARYRFQ